MPMATKSRLGPYEIIALLGAGGSAKSTRLVTPVSSAPCHQNFRRPLHRALRREARAISSLNYPHICALYDIGREDSTDLLVMEYFEEKLSKHASSRGCCPSKKPSASPSRSPAPRCRAPQGRHPPRPQAGQCHAHPQRS
jgi:hypothetical protein